MAKQHEEKSPEIKAQAVSDYQYGELTTADIAAKYGVSAATITVWAKNAGVPLRTRGRWKQTVPDARQAEIIKLCKVYTYQAVADKLGMHKQSVHRIAKRWQLEHGEVPVVPFQPGDQFLWHRKKFTVKEAGIEKGTVVDERGRVYKNFTWGTSRIPKKIGVDSRYATLPDVATVA